MMLMIEFFLAVVGFTCLSFSMARHHRDVFGSMPTKERVRLFKSLGSVALLICTAICVAGWGWTVGLSRAVLVMAAAGSLVVFVHTYGQGRIANFIKSKTRSSS